MSTLTGWPFWAPSDMEAVERALDLAELSEGEHLVDLGCGDGQVLVAGAQRGSRVSGVECDEDLVEHARRALAENELAGDVQLGDVFEFPLDDADVVFTYLAPATLQRLVRRLQRLDGTRLVTVDFAVPNLQADEVDGRNHLYRLPARPSPRGDVGWQAAGVLVAVTPERHSLTCLSLHHPGGSVAVSVSSELEGVVAMAVGADEVDDREAVAVDLRWEELEPGRFIAGTLACDEVGELPVFAFVDGTEEGLWEVTDDGLDRIRRRLHDGWRPASFDDLLAACDGD